MQVERFLSNIRAVEEPIEKWKMLSALQDRNETLFYKVMLENITEMAPIVYTPTVGQACQEFSNLFRKSRGMYYCANDRGEMSAMTANWPQSEVDVIVVTDGSRILGLGT